MIMIFYILGAAILLVLLYIVIEIKGSALNAFFMKALASFGFIMVFVNASFERDLLKPFIFLFLLGLVSGLLGDLFLALRPLRPKEENEMLINRGILAFSIGHVFYFFGLLMISDFHNMAIVVSVSVTILVIVMSYVLKFDMKKNRISSYIYSFLIFLMVGQTIGLSSVEGFSGGPLILMIGAILFGISDLILAPIYFKGANDKKMVILNLMTYYGAQLLIALSILYL